MRSPIRPRGPTNRRRVGFGSGRAWGGWIDVVMRATSRRAPLRRSHCERRRRYRRALSCAPSCEECFLRTDLADRTAAANRPIYQKYIPLDIASTQIGLPVARPIWGRSQRPVRSGLAITRYVAEGLIAERRASSSGRQRVRAAARSADSAYVRPASISEKNFPDGGDERSP